MTAVPPDKLDRIIQRFATVEHELSSGAGGDAFVKLSILYAHAEWVSKGLLQAGRCYEELEQPLKAKRFYEELLKRFESSPAAEEARQRLKAL